MFLFKNFFGLFPLESGVMVLGFYGIIRSWRCPLFHNVDRARLSINDFCASTIGLSLIFHVMNVITSAMLIFGTVQRNHLYFLPWLIFKLFRIFLYGYSAIMALIQNNLIISAVLIVFFAFSLYLWLGVLSLFDYFKNVYNQEYQIEIKSLLCTSDYEIPPYSTEYI